MTLIRKLSAAILITPLLLSAQDFGAVADGAKMDLQKALAELADAQKQIGAERLPLARQLTEMEQELANQKAAFIKSQRTQENQLVELNALKTETRRQAEEVKYVQSLLAEYSRSFRTRLNFIEEARYQETFAAVDKAAASSELTATEKFTGTAALLNTSLQHAENALGGEIFDGKALDKQGRVQAGKVALFGPVAVFASSAGELAGLLQQELNKSDPTIMDLEKELIPSVRALATSGSGQLVLDPTLGNASKLAALNQSLYDKLAEGGPVMIPLLGLGLAAMLVGVVKWVQLARIRLVPEADLQKVLQHLNAGHQAPALAHARSITGPAGDLLATAIEHMDEKKEYIEEVIYEKMLGFRTKIERGIPFLALTATTGPLLGLLGTVTGMIATFKLISSFGSGDPKLLAAGISEALVATATGMGVAIPSLLFHAFLSRKAKGIVGSMEQTAVGFINGVPQPQEAQSLGK